MLSRFYARILKSDGNWNHNFVLGTHAVAAFLMSATISGFILAMLMNTGDPLKDTAGSSLHVMIKLPNTISLVFGALFVLHAIL